MIGSAPVVGTASAENVGTLLVGAVFVQVLFSKTPTNPWAVGIGVTMAIASYTMAIWLRRKDS